MLYISINLYKKMIDCALAEGISKEVLQDLPFPPDKLEGVQAVPADDFFGLHEFLDKELGPGFALRTGQKMKIEDYGVLGLSWRTCSYAGEIFERSERYFILLSNTYVFKVEEKEDVVEVFLNREPHRRGLELSNEATLSATVVVLQQMTDTDIKPIEVSFKHDAPGNVTDYEKMLGCPVLFNQAAYKITYTQEAFKTRTAKADTNINQFLVERVEEETKGLEVSANKIAIDVKSLIKDALPSGIPSIAQLCELMGMSNRTLTRRLSEGGTTFRDLVHNTQKEISFELLKDPSRNIGEIAFETGFSDQSAFNRAFKKWTGKSPLEYRKVG